MNSFRFYELYVAMNLHFTSDSYDFIKYGGKTRVNVNSFEKRNDKFHFKKQASRFICEDHAIIYLFTNFLNEKRYIISFKKDYEIQFIGYRDAIEYRFKNDYEKYSNIDILDEYFSGNKEVCYYVIIMDALSMGKYYRSLDTKYQDNFLWNEMKKILDIVRPFVIKYMLNDMDERLCKMLRKSLINNTIS